MYRGGAEKLEYMSRPTKSSHAYAHRIIHKTSDARSSREANWPIREHFKELQVTRMVWPPQSPDLNPIENCWGYMKSAYRKSPRFAKNKDELESMVENIWNNIPQEYFRKLIESMASRIQQVLENNGGPTKY